MVKNENKDKNRKESKKNDRTNNKDKGKNSKRNLTWLGKQFYDVWQRDIWISILLVSVLTPQITFFLTATPGYLHKVRLIVSAVTVFAFLAVYINQELFNAYIKTVYRGLGLDAKFGLIYIVLLYMGEIVLSRSITSAYIHQALTKTQLNALAFLSGAYTVFATSVIALLFSGLLYVALRSRYENFDVREEMINSAKKCGQVRRLGGIWLKVENYTLTRKDFEDDEVSIEEKVYHLTNPNG